MSGNSNLVVPIVLWGRQAPTHCISAILLTHNQRTIVSGCNDGQLCLWDVTDDFKITPKCILFGHTAPITCLARGSNAPGICYVVSSSENGEMCSWDVTDGRCIEHVKSPYIHTNIHSYQMIGIRDIRLFCNGYYPEIHIMDPYSLEILFTLSSKVSPDWISALCILRPVKRSEDVVVAMSTSGTVKVWTLSNTDTKSSEPIYEDESKQIRSLNALTLACCAFNQRTILVVCSKYWQIYDAGDFSLLCSMENRRGERWAGGDFLSADRVVLWSNEGKGCLYKLPPNCIPDSADFHSHSGIGEDVNQPYLYHILSIPGDKPLACPPAIRYFLGKRDHFQRLLLRGDSEGRVAVWSIPEVSAEELSKMRLDKSLNYNNASPLVSMSLQEAWTKVNPPPLGIIDKLNLPIEEPLQVTASIYLPQQGRLVCGRDDGSIVIIPATQMVMVQLLSGKQLAYSGGIPPHKILKGHNGRVTCFLYPSHESERYDPQHLVSGGIDFSVCLWDIYSGTLIHTFCVHAGEITQLLVPPNNCNPRVLQCICSVASDHSVALLGLKDRKCCMLASRHLFPVQIIKWRPLDDFMVVGCTDGTVYVWQMETGHLDRVVHGMVAEEILSACDEHVSAGEIVSNSTLQLMRALRHRNLAAIRSAAQKGLQHFAQTPLNQPSKNIENQKSQAYPLLIHGLRTNPKDQDSHVLFFDTEAMIVKLLKEEYASMSPGSLESAGLISQAETQKSANLTQSSSPEAQKKLAGLLAKVKDKAGDVGQKIQATVTESMRDLIPGNDSKDKGSADSANSKTSKPKLLNFSDTSLTMEIAQLFLSCLHAWGLDRDLDRLCISTLGLLQPKCPVTFGLFSRSGHMSLLLPSWRLGVSELDTPPSQIKAGRVKIDDAKVFAEDKVKFFSTRGHWELSTALTTQHLLSVIAIANTLMGMNNATFIPEQEKKRKLLRRLSRRENSMFKSMDQGMDPPAMEEENTDALMAQQAHIKQGWSLLATQHCVLLPELVGSASFKPPQLEMLARRWQDRCLEVREGAQALLLAELRRIGPAGRQAVVDEWAPYLPSYSESYMGGSTPGVESPQGNIIKPETKPEHVGDSEEEDEEDIGEESSTKRVSNTVEAKRKHGTAIVMLGVIGAEFGQEMQPSRHKSADEQKKKGVLEGFGINNHSLARHTSKALTYLLLSAPSTKLPAHTPMRRAAIDLIGRGFTVWEPYLDVSKILLGLLELACIITSDRCTYGQPLSPASDSRRTARHALALIATAKPPAFITTMAKEVARYNALMQNAQSLNINLSNSVLVRAKPEILRVIELLIDKMQSDVADLLVEVIDIIVHCLDPNNLKSKGLGEAFPAIMRFNMVSFCPQTRRIAVGAKNGGLAIYELRTSKCQMIPAHSGPITACSFSLDGKYLASYSHKENKLNFWQTATGLFGIGSAQIKCVRSYNTTPLPPSVTANPLRMTRLIWTSQKNVILMLSDGTEYRYNT